MASSPRPIAAWSGVPGSGARAWAETWAGRKVIVLSRSASQSSVLCPGIPKMRSIPREGKPAVRASRYVLRTSSTPWIPPRGLGREAGGAPAPEIDGIGRRRRILREPVPDHIHLPREETAELRHGGGGGGNRVEVAVGALPRAERYVQVDSPHPFILPREGTVDNGRAINTVVPSTGMAGARHP